MMVPGVLGCDSVDGLGEFNNWTSVDEVEVHRLQVGGLSAR
jgi:hypothetical protein